MTETHPTDALIQVGQEMYQRGWMLATGGNLSARHDGRVFMSASGGHKGRLTADDFLQLSTDGTAPAGDIIGPTSRRPSAETVVHVALYRAAADAAHVGAIVHVHAPYMTLVSRHYQSRGFVRFEGWEFIKALGFWAPNAVVNMPIVNNHHDIPTLATAVVNASFGVQADNADAPAAPPAVLVAGHGVYAWGATVADAQRHVEATEFLCRMVWESR